MPITEARIGRLRGFGLSEYAARAYLALLDLGAAEARDVSNLSKVPTSKIYHVLDQLHERGLVEVLPEFPKRYAPVPFDDFLDKRRKDHEEAARTLERERDDLVASFAIAGDVRVADRGGLQVVRGRANVHARLVEAIDAARADVLLLASHGMPSRAEVLRPALDAARARGVALRVLVPPGADASALAAPACVGTLAAGEQASAASVLVVDATRAALVTFVPDDDSHARGKDVAAFIDHTGLVAAVRALVERDWARAEGVRTDPFDARALVARLAEPALLVERGLVRAVSPPLLALAGISERDTIGQPLERILPSGWPQQEPEPADGRLRVKDAPDVRVALTMTELDTEGRRTLIILRPEGRMVEVEGVTEGVAEAVAEPPRTLKGS